MSADLFAEFNSQPNSPRPPQNQHRQDPFAAFGQPATISQSSSQSWTTLQPQTSSFSSWTEVQSPVQQQAQPADDDDGWGDFETAEESKPPPPPAAAAAAAAPPPPKPALPQNNSSFSAWDISSQNAPVPISWDAPTSAPAPAAVPANAPSSVASKKMPPFPTRIVRASTLDLMSNNLVDFESNPQPQVPPKPAPNRSPAPPPAKQEQAQPIKSRPKLVNKTTDPSILFDVADFELEGGEDDDDDEDGEDFGDFGDFETGAPIQTSQPKPTAPIRPAVQTMPSMDLLSLQDDSSSPAPTKVRAAEPLQNSPPKSASLPFGATNTKKSQLASPQSNLALGPKVRKSQANSTKPKQSSALAKAAKVNEDDEWSAWDDFTPIEPAKKKKAATESGGIKTAGSSDNWNWDSVDTSKPSTQEKNDNAPPPINVPPPSVLLSAFPELLGSGDALFNPISGQAASIKQRILSDPQAVDFLQGYILLATTAARVMAGRKQRWHRDKILAKSMSISAAGSKGMKLAGVDKTQAAREDREAADVVAVWRDHVGRLRSAVAAANSTGKANLKVPELSESLTIQTAKNVPTAPKPCIICGLKREERVGKVDYDVEDSFGEWWAEHWGHRACKNFWVEHEQRLRQR